MQNQWASLSTDGRIGHLLIHMQLETRAPGYWLVHIVVQPIGLQFPLAPEFPYIKPSLHLWDEAYLLMMDDHSDVFLDLVCEDFIEYFYIDTHKGN